MNRKNPWLKGNSVWNALSAFPWLNYNETTGKGGKPHTRKEPSSAAPDTPESGKKFRSRAGKVVCKNKNSRSGDPTGRAPPKLALVGVPGTYTVFYTDD